MKQTIFLPVLAVAALIASPIVADDDHENHEIIEKVMKEGLKGDESPLAKVLEGEASKSEIKDLDELIKTMEGTKAPVGDQAGYDEKVAELIAAIGAVAGGATDTPALNRLDTASDCKACHGDHKPKKEKK
ncbi:MAG: hypothetical protein P1U86_09205 [Verrucomicrobiales bacterium]|nr:hypothetical protein [Verrucomicrobiales bacterium]